MVPVKPLSSEHHVYDDGEDHEAHAFLNHFQLHESERSSVVYESYSVCRHLAAVFKEGDSP